MLSATNLGEGLQPQAAETQIAGATTMVNAIVNETLRPFCAVDADQFYRLLDRLTGAEELPDVNEYRAVLVPRHSCNSLDRAARRRGHYHPKLLLLLILDLIQF